MTPRSVKRMIKLRSSSPCDVLVNPLIEVGASLLGGGGMAPTAHPDTGARPPAAAGRARRITANLLATQPSPTRRRRHPAPRILRAVAVVLAALALLVGGRPRGAVFRPAESDRRTGLAAA